MALLKGWLGEKKTAFKMWIFLSNKVYRRYHNVIIPSSSGTTQIDHLVMSPYGLFIVETKNKKGWIFGSEKGSTWTQIIYGNNYSFQNPLRQTYRQMKILSGFLGVEESLVHPVIYFSGDCTFKTRLPSNVINSKLSKYIKTFDRRVLSSEKVTRLINALESHLAESDLSKKDHIRSLKQRHQSKIICPKCGGQLVERTAKKGFRKGRSFLGCERFPECRFTRSL